MAATGGGDIWLTALCFNAVAVRTQRQSTTHKTKRETARGRKEEEQKAQKQSNNKSPKKGGWSDGPPLPRGGWRVCSDIQHPNTGAMELVGMGREQGGRQGREGGSLGGLWRHSQAEHAFPCAEGISRDHMHMCYFSRQRVYGIPEHRWDSCSGTDMPMLIWMMRIGTISTKKKDDEIQSVIM